MIQIALGIVLGFIILACLPVIIKILGDLLGWAISVAIVFAVVFVVLPSSDPEGLMVLGGLFLIALVSVGVLALLNRLSRSSVHPVPRSDAANLSTIPTLAPTSGHIGGQVEQSASPGSESAVARLEELLSYGHAEGVRRGLAQGEEAILETRSLHDRCERFVEALRPLVEVLATRIAAKGFLTRSAWPRCGDDGYTPVLKAVGPVARLWLYDSRAPLPEDESVVTGAQLLAYADFSADGGATLPESHPWKVCFTDARNDHRGGPLGPKPASRTEGSFPDPQAAVGFAARLLGEVIGEDAAGRGV
ncbi:MAG: hypothetical protein ACKVZ0_00145 [Gemmatimonadales bacterium]